MRTTSTRWATTASGTLTLSILLLIANALGLGAEEQPIRSVHSNPPSTGPVEVLRNRLGFLDWAKPFAGSRFSRFDFPVQPRVSHSAKMLRRCELVTGDQFVGELLDWNGSSVLFRLLTGQQIRVPVVAILRLSNPPSEVDFIDESFESDSAVRKRAPSLIDESQSADGSASLRITEPYRVDFGESLEAARIEFLFFTTAEAASGGQWQIEVEKNSSREAPVTIQIDNGVIACTNDFVRRSDASTQPLPLTTGWHTFIAIVSPERTRLLVDQSTLASFPTNGLAIKSIQFLPSASKPQYPLLVDALQVRRLVEIENSPPPPFDQDAIELATGDLWLGKLVGLTLNGAILKAQNQTTPVSWNKIVSISRVQSDQPLRQMASVATGLFSTIELQPFVERPECPPDRWTVTITRSDSNGLTAMHSLVGELNFRWSDIARIRTEFFGQSLLLDGRHLHLGNSIRTEFQHPSPNGTRLQSAFQLRTIPPGQPFISMNISEMEAAGSDAPPASPFLAELRAGKLTTELVINEKRVGDLNSLIRFKAKSPRSDRIRIPFSREFLRAGKNVVELSQKPLSDSQREFDDCEIHQLRLEFDLSDPFE